MPKAINNKKIIPYIGLALVLIAAALVAYIMIVSPQKAPYKDALAQYKNVYNANVVFTQIGASLGANTASDDQFTANIEKARSALKDLQTETAALAQKEILKTGEGQKLYEAFNNKLADYAAYNTAILDSIQKVRPILFECSQNASSVAETASSAQAVRTCATNLAAIKDIPDVDYKQMVDSFSSIYDALATNIATTAGLKDSDGADKGQYNSLSSERSDILSQLTDASSTLTKNLQTHRSAVDITETAMALDDYLSSHARLFW